MKKTPTAAASAVAALQEIIRADIKPVPKHCFTQKQYMEAKGVSRITAQLDLQRLITAGRIERKRHPAIDSMGRRCHINIYCKK